MNQFELNHMRAQLLMFMSAVSEDIWAAGWLTNLDRDLYRQGGLWEVIGRHIGWPLGFRGEDGWVEWDDAGEYYAKM